MKVLLLNGSAKRNGCTNEALSEIASVLESEGISAEIFHIGTDAICDCTGCGACAHLGKCIYGDDGVNEFTARAADADGFVFGTPVYYAHRPAVFSRSSTARSTHRGRFLRTSPVRR